MPRGFCKGRKLIEPPQLPPAPWSGYKLRHTAVKDVLKPLLPLLNLPCEWWEGPFREMNSWGMERVNGKEGGRGNKWKREREEEWGIGNRKGSPHISLPKRMDEFWSDCWKFHFSCSLPCYFITVNELQEQISVVVISVPFLLYFLFSLFLLKFDFKNRRSTQKTQCMTTIKFL